MKEKQPLYILDVYAFIYRSYFAFIHKPLRNSRGENVSAIFGFFRFLFSLFEQRKPELFAAALDSIGPTFRHIQLESYKATRPKTPEELIAQIPRIEAILNALEVLTIRSEGYEADDVIATLAARCAKEGRPCYVVSGDKDLLQLVGGQTMALRPSENFGYRELGTEEVLGEWGVRPDQIRDYLSLTGDASDNVPGVKGIGDKTAQKLIARFGSLDSIYEDLSRVEPESLRKKLEEGRENAFLSKELISLCYEVPNCPTDVANLRAKLNFEAAAPLLLHEGIKSLVPEALRNAKQQTTPVPAPATGAEKAATEAGVAKADREFDFGDAGVLSNTDAFTTAHPVSPGSLAPSTLRSAANNSTYRAVLEPELLDDIVERALAAGMVAFDTETDSLDPHHAHILGFSISYEHRQAWYVPLRAPDTICVEPERAFSALARLFASGKLLLIGHNLKFDINVLAASGVEVRSRCFDTMIAAWVLDAESPSFSLSAVAGRYLGLSGLEYEEVVPKGGTFAEVALDRAIQYASEDADFSFQLYERLEGEIEKAGLHALFYDIEMPVLPILARMERIGIKVDADRLRAYGVELEGELARVQIQVYDLVGHEFNLASPKQLAEVLFTERKLPVQKRTKTGFSTDTSVLEELAPLDPVPQLILRHRLLAKLKSTYIEPLADLASVQGRVHTTFVQTGAATGRLSSRDPNLQNIPIREEEGRKIRAAFVAEEGKTLISADYSQIELVVMAHLSKDPNLAKAFKEGVDIHRRTASLIFGVPESEIDAEKRRIAKTINFGVIYGMSAFRLARDLGIPNAVAKGFIDTYFATYAGIAEFIRKTVLSAQETGISSTLFGRRRRILGIDSRNKTEQQAAQRVAVNTPIQGSAADIVKIAMIRVQRMLEREMPEVKMLLQVHDELIFEAPESLVEPAMARIKEEMEGAVRLDVPLRVSVEAAKSWGDMHL